MTLKYTGYRLKMALLDAAKMAKIGKNYIWGALTPKSYDLGKTPLYGR